MKIAIDVNFEPGPAGGVASAVRGLISALGLLTDGPEQYAILVESDQQVEWLSPLAANQKFVWRPKSRRAALLRRGLWRLDDWFSRPRKHWPSVPLSTGFFESLDCDVVHFPTQEFTVCALPSIYNPHDLQHLHYPQFFAPGELAWRETIYRAGCHFARTVVVNSQWVKNDIVEQYRVSPGKVQVIPEAPSTQFLPVASPEDGVRLKKRYGLRDDFVLYPGTTWPHKNHLRLLDAISYLRDERGLAVPVVCTGSPYQPEWRRIEQRMIQLGLNDQVRFLGFVPFEDLRGLYRLARCLVLPTLFEASSLPIFEAWLEGTPVASSNATALPEQIMNAGLLFDPFDHIAIAESIGRLYSDARLRKELRAKGKSRLADFDWLRTAKAYRAVYRRAAHGKLAEEDRRLLSWNWMQDATERCDERAGKTEA